MEKTRVRYVCQQCGHASPKWLGRCPACGEWNSLVEEPVAVRPPRSLVGAEAGAPVPITSVTTAAEPRARTGIEEFDRVLGGGVVPGSLVLVAGDPGIGKSTLVLQAAHRLASDGALVLYVTGEESVRQTRLRAERLGADAASLYVLAETNLEEIVRHVQAMRPQFAVMDSIQTVYRPDLPSAPGSVAQVRESAAELLRLAKRHGVTVFLIGHVTKDGQIAGPRVLEHIVDTVLYFEGDRHHAYRVLRTTKNRFGSTNEVGIFEMGGAGLTEVPNPSAAFLSDRSLETPGSAVVCTMEGTRPLLVEVQALVSPIPYGTPRRTASGVDYNRTQLLLAVLEKRAGLHLASQDVFVNVAGGVRLDEPGVDLGVVLAVASSFRERPLPRDVVAIGEVGLGGEVRAVGQIARRLGEAAKLGFTRAVIPERSGGGEPLPDLATIPARTVSDVLALLLD